MARRISLVAGIGIEGWRRFFGAGLIWRALGFCCSLEFHEGLECT